jgi:hypothetical protein
MLTLLLLLQSPAISCEAFQDMVIRRVVLITRRLVYEDVTQDPVLRLPSFSLSYRS